MYIALNYNITLKECKYNIDHVCILLKVYPKIEIAKFINCLQKRKTEIIKKKYNNKK